MADADLTVTETEQFVLTIGEIGVSPHWVVTPAGHAPLASTRWSCRDETSYYNKHAWWTILLAVVLFPIGLLFLLITTERMRGHVEVEVRGAELLYTARLSPPTQDQVKEIRRNVATATSMATALNSSPS